jgi:hypothetical protein
MATELTPAPDWFDRLWDAQSHKLPIYLRNDSGKKVARSFVAGMIETLGAAAKTPEGMRQVVAYARIAAILRGSRGILDQPDPSPEQVADAVERLVQRLKP